ERSFRGDALDLRKHNPAGISRGDRQRQVLERERFALGRDIAVRIRGGAADQRYLDRERLVEKVLLAVDLHQPHDVLGGQRVHTAAVLTRIDVGAEADARQRAWLAGADVAVHVRNDALGQVVRLDAVVDDQLLDRR